MQTLNYKELLVRIQQLDPVEQFRLLEELAALVRSRTASRSRRSILELQGLGKKIWQGLDAQEFIDRERASWDG
ncbi:MAG TPA: hypothetical protein ENG23_01075 [Methanomicrobia archaeon]|nr:hypothetical protein [Methanomicrobia archaeon]